MLQFYSEDRCQTCPDRVVCRCLQVTESQIVESITTSSVRTVKDLCRATGAGDGCTCCHQHLKGSDRALTAALIVIGRKASCEVGTFHV